MKRVFAIICASLLALAAHAQPQFNWAQRTGSNGEEDCKGMDVDAAGNIYATGCFHNTVDFDPGPGTVLLTSAGGADLYYAKYDAAGNLLWVKQVGGADNEVSHGIALDPSGNLCITGGFDAYVNGVDFDPGPGTTLLFADSGATFLAKYDTNGNYIWSESFGGWQSGGSSIAVDNDGNIVVGGKFKTGLDGLPVDFDPGPGFALGWSIAISSVYYARYNSSGDFLWFNQIAYPWSGQGVEIGDLSVDGSNNVYVTGMYTGDSLIIGGFTLPSAGGYKAYLAKCNSLGGVVWAYGFNETQSFSHSSGNDVACDDSGNVYITGELYTPTDFDPGPDTVVVYPPGEVAVPTCFTAKYTTNGSLSWAKSPDFANDGGGIAIDVDECGSVYVLTKSGIKLLKYNYSGDALWEADLLTVTPYAGFEDASLKVSPNGHFNIAGSLWGAVDFDPGAGSTVITADSLTDIVMASYENNGIGLVNGPGSYCYGDTVTYTVAPVAGATSYVWTLPTGWTGTSTTSAITAIAASSGTITVDAVNGCNASPQSFNAVASMQAPAVPQIYGDALACNGNLYWYTAVSDSGVTYNWSYPSDWLLYFGEYGNDLVDSIGFYGIGSNGALSVTASNGCLSAPQTLNVAYAYSPLFATPPQFISGAEQLCAGATDVYSVSFDTSLVTVDYYTWTLPSGWSGSSLSDSITATAGNNGGPITVSANNVCGSGPAQTLDVAIVTVDTSVSATAGVLSANVDSATYQWIDCASGNALSETNQTFTPAVTGTYAVVVDQSGCSDTSGCHTVIVTSTSPTTSGIATNVYPNPSFGTFTLAFAAGQVYRVEITDMLGRCVYRAATTKGNGLLQMHLSDTGVYSLNVTNEFTTTTHKLVVQKQH